MFQLKKSQIHIEDVLTAKHISFEKIDISAPQSEDKKTFMRENASSPGGKTPLPPQIFLEDEYCGVSVHSDGNSQWPRSICSKHLI